MKRLIYFLLVISLFSFGCSVDEDDGPSKSGTVAGNTSPIDPKSLVDTKSESILMFDEIGGQIPKTGVPNTVKSPSFVVRGWAIDQGSKSVAGGVIISVDGKDVLANYGLPRPDVADNLKSPNYLNSGFTATLDTSTIGKGKHTMSFRVVTSDRKGYYQQKPTYDVVVE